MKRIVFAAFLVLAPVAYASEPVEGHGAAGHEVAAHEGGEVHEGGEGHARFTDDDDHDGTINWMDSDSHAYILYKLAVHGGNLVLFALVVGLLARRPVSDALGNRAIGVRKAIAEASDAHTAAQAKMAQVTRRLDVLDAEIAKMRADAKVSIAEEEAKLVQRAHDEAARIAETAERNIREELLRARTALRKEAVDLAVAAAEETLKKQVHPSDQRRLARSFLETLGDARG